MNFLIDRSANADAVMVLAHGAGAPMDSMPLTALTHAISAAGVSVYRFEFDYMAQRRTTGKRRPPNRQPVLLDNWRKAIAQVRTLEPDTPLVLAGKSLGGRMASLIVDETDACALVLFGYPFHPQGKPDKLRTDHLYQLQTPTLIVQGSRDALGSFDEVQCYALPTAISQVWLTDGDHDFKPRRRSGFTHQQHLQSAAAAAMTFIRKHT